MKSLLIIVSTLFYITAYSQSVSIKGKVINNYTGEPLAGATVSLANTQHKTITDNSGNYVFTKVERGDYMLVVEYVGFVTATKHVKLTQEQAKLNINLEEKVQELQYVNVFGRINQEEDAGARQKEKKASNIMNIVSAQSMERSPDINAANVLRRVSGLTIQQNGGGDEAYPIIRGLDPRYNNTLIDGIKITSPDDKSRYVPLNVVP